MRYKTRRLLAIGAILAIVASSGAAIATATAASGAKSTARGGLIGAVTSYLGITAKQLRVELASGKSLAQIATAHGRSLDGLEQTIETTVKSRLDQAVTAGAITAQQEQKVLTRLHSHLDALVGRSHPLAALRQGLKLKVRGLVQVTTRYLGVTPQQLRTELEAGKTLAQVATAHGKTVAGLEQAITSAVKTRLDKAVAAGYLNASTEQKILTRLGQRLDALVNRSFTH